MKRNIFIKLLTLIIFLMAYMVSFAQAQSQAQPQAQDVEITMIINYGVWENGEDKWYNAIIFKDSDTIQEKIRKSLAGKKDKDSIRRGRSFKSKVKRNQKIIWISDWENGTDIKQPPTGTKIILVSVARNPGNGGDYLLDELWYDAKYDENGEKFFIEGRTKKTGFPKTGSEERYIISFAIAHPDGTYDIYTVDPILKGHQ